MKSMRVLVAKVESMSNKSFCVTINWPFLLAFVTFWSYGWQPILSRDALLLQVGVALYTIFILSIYLSLGLNKALAFSSQIAFSFKDCFALIAIVGVWSVIGFLRLHEPISGDQFYYSLGAKLHEIFILELIGKNSFLESISLANLIHGLDVLLLLVGLSILFLLKRLKVYKPLFWIVVVVIILSARFFSLYIGIGGSPHPPFQLFPIWVGTSLLGISEYSLRLSQYVGLMICSGVIYWIFCEQIGRLSALILGVTVCSIPLYVHVASMVEGSGWATLIIFIVLSTIIFKAPEKFSSWFGIASLICTFTLMRLTSFLIFPIFLFFYFSHYKKNDELIGLNRFSIILLPALVCLPFFVMSVVAGTPATFIPGEAEFIAGSSSTLNRLLYALNEGVISGTSIASIGGLWLIFILGVFIRDSREPHYLKNRFLIISLLALLIATFFSIRPVLWGADRYKAEYLVPFIMLGVTLLLLKIFDLRLKKGLFYLFSFGLFGLGVLGFLGYPQRFEDPMIGTRFQRQSEFFYDYKTALKDAQIDGFSKHLIVVGVTYGVMPQILSGYSIAEVVASKQNYDQFYAYKRSGESVLKALAAIPNIELVLLMDSGSLQDRAELVNAGWVAWKEYATPGGGTIFALKRSSAISN